MELDNGTSKSDFTSIEVAIVGSSRSGRGRGSGVGVVGCSRSIIWLHSVAELIGLKSRILAITSTSGLWLLLCRLWFSYEWLHMQPRGGRGPLGFPDLVFSSL